jgi:hypothetical protein
MVNLPELELVFSHHRLEFHRHLAAVKVEQIVL